MAGELLIREAGTRGISNCYLALEKLSQKRYSFRSAPHGNGQIRRHLAHGVVLPILLQDGEIFFQGGIRFALLEEFFGAFYALRDVGAVSHSGSRRTSRDGSRSDSRQAPERQQSPSQPK